MINLISCCIYISIKTRQLGEYRGYRTICRKEAGLPSNPLFQNSWLSQIWKWYALRSSPSVLEVALFCRFPCPTAESTHCCKNQCGVSVREHRNALPTSWCERPRVPCHYSPGNLENLELGNNLEDHGTIQKNRIIYIIYIQLILIIHIYRLKFAGEARWMVTNHGVYKYNPIIQDLYIYIKLNCILELWVMMCMIFCMNPSI